MLFQLDLPPFGVLFGVRALEGLYWDAACVARFLGLSVSKFLTQHRSHLQLLYTVVSKPKAYSKTQLHRQLFRHIQFILVLQETLSKHARFVHQFFLENQQVELIPSVEYRHAKLCNQKVPGSHRFWTWLRQLREEAYGGLVSASWKNVPIMSVEEAGASKMSSHHMLPDSNTVIS